jgi:hypothetical protein
VSDWRVIITDGEDETGVAPVCINTTAANNGPHADHREPWVYSCCPRPHIECGTRSAARTIRDALTAADAEVI